MTVFWPSDLPCPSRIGYGLGFGDGRLARNAEAGPPAFRRRFSMTAKTISAAITATQDQYALFSRFYETTLKNGTLPFIMADRLTDGTMLLDEDLLPILSEEDEPILLDVNRLYLFGTDTPKVSGGISRYQIAFTLMEMP